MSSNPSRQAPVRPPVQLVAPSALCTHFAFAGPFLHSVFLAIQSWAMLFVNIAPVCSADISSSSESNIEITLEFRFQEIMSWMAAGQLETGTILEVYK